MGCHSGVIEGLENPGAFAAFTHYDPCPDNCQWVDGKVVLLDFEGGAFRHALLDGTYGRIHFPSCWCVNRIPEDVPRRMDEEYRNELIDGCPEAADDAAYRRAVVMACAKGATGTWWSKLMEEDGDWGISTYRQRVLLRFSLFARLTEEYGQFEALGRWLEVLGARLREQWGDVEEMPLYPAFRERD